MKIYIDKIDEKQYAFCIDDVKSKFSIIVGMSDLENIKKQIDTALQTSESRYETVWNPRAMRHEKVKK